jgi:DNA-binding beta-propeller fold protein YncE
MKVMKITFCKVKTMQMAMFISMFILMGIPEISIAVNKIYWTSEEIGKIQRAGMDGTDIEDIVTGVYSESIALDEEAGKIYWSDSNGIQCANLDGTDITVVIPGVESQGIALDVNAGKIYWANQSPAKIQRAGMDGSNVEDLVSLVAIGGPFAIALDKEAGKMYWTIEGSVSIQRANLNGDGLETLVTGFNFFEGIALDVSEGKMYWTDEFTKRIWHANLDGTDVEFMPTVGSPEGIAIDNIAGKLYWTDDDEENGKILRSNLNGSAVEEIVTGLSGPGGIALYFHAQDELCKGDLDKDKDVDGKDLATQADGDTGVDLEDFAASFGRNECP